MDKLIYHSLFIAIYAILYSTLEIETEGKDGGWAKNLPTAPSGIGPLTYYHAIMNIIVILTVSYSTFLVSKKISVILFFIISWFLIEDFGWFVLNPYFTLKKYTKKDIWWHGRQPWILGSPLHNWIGIGCLFGLAFLSQDKKKLGKSFITMISVVLLTIMSAPFYHAWYKSEHNVKEEKIETNTQLKLNKETIKSDN